MDKRVEAFLFVAEKDFVLKLCSFAECNTWEFKVLEYIEQNWCILFNLIQFIYTAPIHNTSSQGTLLKK